MGTPSPQSKSPARVNVAVVGLGFMGTTHLRAYLRNPQALVVAVCDASRVPVNGVLPGIAGNVQSTGDVQLPTGTRVFRSLEQVLADPEVELVDLCTPTPLHPEQVLASLRAGKHVLCEKPLARSSKQARELSQAAETSRGKLMPAMCMRFWPGWAWLKQVVADKPFGRVLAARFRRVSAMPAWSKQGTYSGGVLGGALFDLHIHDVDFVYCLFGRPSSVYATGVTAPDNSVTHVVAQYHFPGGPGVYAEGSWLLAGGFSMGYTVYCETATLDFDSARAANPLLVTRLGEEPEPKALEPGDGYEAEITYFLDCILRQQPSSRSRAEDAVAALEICEAEETSLRTSSKVRL